MSVIYVTESGTMVGREGGQFYISKGQERLCEVPEETLEGLVLFGGVQVSAAAVTALLRQEVPVAWMSAKGRFQGRLDSMGQGHVLRQRSQFRLTEKSESRLHLARKFIAAKIHNQRVLLRKHPSPGPIVGGGVLHLAALEQKVEETASIEELMGLEGAAARRYFSCLAHMVPETFFEGRRSRRPPQDAFNSLLSFGYHLLFTEIYTAIIQTGLHPDLGFLHSLHPKHPALVSDLMEEWRPVIVDSLALALLSRSSLQLSDFQAPDERGGVYLTDGGRKRFLQAYEKKMRQEQQYLGTALSFRQGLVRQARSLTRAVEVEELPLYQPVRIR